MAIRRETRTPVIRGGRQFGTSQAIQTIKAAVEAGEISVRESIMQGEERLDVIAGRTYGDAKNWWVIAAASGIGWVLQVPPGTRLLIPTDLSQVTALVG